MGLCLSICSIGSLRLRCQLLPAQHPQQYSPPHISPTHFLGKAGLAKSKSVVPSYAIKHSRYSRHTAALLLQAFSNNFVHFTDTLACDFCQHYADKIIGNAFYQVYHFGHSLDRDTDVIQGRYGNSRQARECQLFFLKIQNLKFGKLTIR